MTTYLEVIPAYGRTCKSVKEVRLLYDAGKDFQVAKTGQYINKAGKPADVALEVRYGRDLLKSTIIR